MQSVSRLLSVTDLVTQSLMTMH